MSFIFIDSLHIMLLGSFAFCISHIRWNLNYVCRTLFFRTAAKGTQKANCRYCEENCRTRRKPLMPNPRSLITFSHVPAGIRTLAAARTNEQSLASLRALTFKYIPSYWRERVQLSTRRYHYYYVQKTANKDSTTTTTNNCTYLPNKTEHAT